MLTASFVPHSCELHSSIPQVPVNARPIRKVKCNGPEHLFQGEGGKRVDDTFRRLAPKKGVNDGVEGNPAPGDEIPGFTLFDVSRGHTALCV
jgi:hypothetical protein